ncbi:hypothetical protein Pmani_002652 [Petrolisthes manimaculis]|uniref:Uncharacterized protein n=1 Tax=Petrolisthes manimaculis TaxID=1843537 RepID=A0AAE1UK61_9EUCA|nr:hypothetical protein Pmani_002652 [Petrolisthes manimaculis]
MVDELNCTFPSDPASPPNPEFPRSTTTIYCLLSSANRTCREETQGFPWDIMTPDGLGLAVGGPGGQERVDGPLLCWRVWRPGRASSS